MGGVTKFYRDGHPTGDLWLTRALLYGGVTWYCDLHQKVYTYAKSGGKGGPVNVDRRASTTTSEPASEYEDA